MTRLAPLIIQNYTSFDFYINCKGRSNNYDALESQGTGLDPPGIKVRASKGLAAVDYFLPGYHVWAHVIEALSDFGYDLNNMVRHSCVGNKAAEMVALKPTILC